ncbi:histidine kinase [Lacibacter sp. MH-610]|uniref:sensor histidine kinase n=1 Tax=Lacibacter sp. MH-610 TaxID=3020883 RepID=UPI003891C1A5
MKLHLPQYNGKDNLVMAIVVPLFGFVFNIVNFPVQYFSDLFHFIVFTVLSIFYFCIYFIICGGIAVVFKNAFPLEKDLPKRLFITIIVFLLTTGLFLYGILQTYEWLPWFNYTYNEKIFLWNYFSLGIINIFLIFLMEGIRRYNDWKENMKETEKLDAAYRQSRLNALKSQVNPHFLFNSLNTLSGLIQEDEERAEAFLNEMSKVYRYMLRTDEEQFVTLDTELKFVQSYQHLLSTRYGDALRLHVQVQDEHSGLYIAPLTLQVIIENAFTQNVLSKARPLFITIQSSANGHLLIQNNIQLKQVKDVLDTEAGLDNLVKKYALMGMPVKVDDTQSEIRTISIPLLKQEEVAA